jgi:hypothetical protein
VTKPDVDCFGGLYPLLSGLVRLKQYKNTWRVRKWQGRIGFSNRFYPIKVHVQTIWVHLPAGLLADRHLRIRALRAVVHNKNIFKNLEFFYRFFRLAYFLNQRPDDIYSRTF